MTDDGGAIEKWYSPRELAELRLTGMPSSLSAIHNMIAEGEWRECRDLAGRLLYRRRKGRGGGWEYSPKLLPVEARQDLLGREKAAAEKAEAADAAPAAPPVRALGAAEVWAHFERQTEARRDAAREKLEALDRVAALVARRVPKNVAVATVAAEVKKSVRTLYRWEAMIPSGTATSDRWPYLVDLRGGARR